MSNFQINLFFNLMEYGEKCSTWFHFKIHFCVEHSIVYLIVEEVFGSNSPGLYYIFR